MIFSCGAALARSGCGLKHNCIETQSNYKVIIQLYCHVTIRCATHILNREEKQLLFKVSMNSQPPGSWDYNEVRRN